jgi:hypothetical protein
MAQLALFPFPLAHAAVGAPTERRPHVYRVPVYRVGALRKQRESQSVNSVHQECWNSPVHTRLIPASNGLKTSKEAGECSMPGKGIQG